MVWITECHISRYMIDRVMNLVSEYSLKSDKTNNSIHEKQPLFLVLLEQVTFVSARRLCRALLLLLYFVYFYRQLCRTCNIEQFCKCKFFLNCTPAQGLRYSFVNNLCQYFSVDIQEFAMPSQLSPIPILLVTVLVAQKHSALDKLSQLPRFNQHYFV